MDAGIVKDHKVLHWRDCKMFLSRFKSFHELSHDQIILYSINSTQIWTERQPFKVSCNCREVK